MPFPIFPVNATVRIMVYLYRQAKKLFAFLIVLGQHVVMKKILQTILLSWLGVVLLGCGGDSGILEATPEEIPMPKNFDYDVFWELNLKVQSACEQIDQECMTKVWDDKGNRDGYGYLPVNVEVPNTGTFTDSRGSGHEYKWVEIGTQVWMAENLKYDPGEMGNGTCYEDSIENCDTYGMLYAGNPHLFPDAVDNMTEEPIPPICSDGWHIPSNSEWLTLITYLETAIGIPEYFDGFSFRQWGQVLKASQGWDDDGNGLDYFGFNGLPGGTWEWGYDPTGLGETGVWWSSTVVEGRDQYFNSWQLHAGSSALLTYHEHYTQRASVRCVKD